MVATSFDCSRPNYLHKTKLIGKPKVVRRVDDMSGMKNLDSVRCTGCGGASYSVMKESMK